jgi:hypothetical protein
VIAGGPRFPDCFRLGFQRQLQVATEEFVAWSQAQLLVSLALMHVNRIRSNYLPAS